MGLKCSLSRNVSGLKTSSTANGIRRPAAATLLFVCCSIWAFVLHALPDSCLIVLAALPNLPWGRDEKLLRPGGQIVYRPNRPVLATLLRTTCLAGTRDHSLSRQTHRLPRRCVHK